MTSLPINASPSSLIFASPLQKQENTDEKEIQTLTNIIKYLNDNNKIKARSLVSKLWRFLRGILVKK
jgi:hypothetical protein